MLWMLMLVACADVTDTAADTGAWTEPEPVETVAGVPPDAIPPGIHATATDARQGRAYAWSCTQGDDLYQAAVNVSGDGSTTYEVSCGVMDTYPVNLWNSIAIVIVDASGSPAGVAPFAGILGDDGAREAALTLRLHGHDVVTEQIPTWRYEAAISEVVATSRTNEDERPLVEVRGYLTATHDDGRWAAEVAINALAVDYRD